MISFLLAFQFLTILPIRIKEAPASKLARAPLYFPLIGFFLGAMLVWINSIMSLFNFPQLSADIILVITLAAITGGIHLDGLADTADAFLSGKSREEMLMIMRDPHIGTMGVLSMTSVLLLKISLLLAMPASLKAASLLLMCVLSRWSLVLSMFLFPYARSNGKARVFIEGMNAKIFIISTVIACLLGFLTWQMRGLLVMAVVCAVVFLLGRFILRRIGGITGDTLGAVNELAEVAVLCVVIILGGG
jgi:adenosylcobinamide-GDP ribazoletransferase